MTNETSQKKKSLCEKSMMLVANIIKLSSLSLSSTIYGTTFKQPPIDAVPATAKVPSANVSMLPQVPRSQGSQEPESNSKQNYSYFIELEKENSSHVICENDIDERAADYIKRTHERNRNDLNTASKRFSYILPPTAALTLRQTETTEQQPILGPSPYDASSSLTSENRLKRGWCP